MWRNFEGGTNVYEDGTTQNRFRVRLQSQAKWIGIGCVRSLSKLAWHTVKVAGLRAMLPQISEICERQDFFPTTEEQALAIRGTLLEQGFDVRDFVID